MTTVVSEHQEDIACLRCDEIWEDEVHPWVAKEITCPACGTVFYLDWDAYYNEETGDSWEGFLLTEL